eukprot:355410_1
MALEHKDFSEQEELLSDIGGVHDVADIGNQNNGNDEDPLVKAALAKHNDNVQLADINDNNIAGINELQINEMHLERNTFIIPISNTRISCGISWLFLNENKIIDVDLIVTALDIYSFEMDSVNKDHKKMFKKSITYSKANKNKNNDKLIHFKLDSIPENCYSLWFIINAYNGDSLKHIDKAIFNIYPENGNDKDKNDRDDKLYTYEIGMGFDVGAILLGILYRNASDNKQWNWTIVEEKNLYALLIKNNLALIYDDKIIEQRPNDKNTKFELTKCNEKYIIDSNINKLQIGIGWDLSTNVGNDDNEDNDRQKIVDCIDIDVDGSVIVYGKKIDNENDLEEIDMVNNNNNFYKTYVQYIKNENYGPNINDNDDKEELGVINDIDEDEEIFDIYLNKINSDNDVNSMCILLNIFNDNNIKNKDKTNNVTNCYVRLIDFGNDKKEICRYKLTNINSDRKTCALVLGYMRKLDNGCWSLNTNDLPLKTNSSLDYQEYAKQIVLGKYSSKNGLNKDACCIIL